MASKPSLSLAELKRRKVYRVAGAYVIVGAVLAGAANDILPRLGLPEWTVSFVIILLLLGFPIALVLAWAYEVKPEGPREAEKASAPAIDTSESEQRKSIVVLPFDNMSPDPGDAYFADGLTEEIITNLSHILSLRVISRNSAMAQKGTKKSTRAIAEELDVQYVLEGSVRKAGDDLRITAQLINARSDEHLWAESYDGVLEDVFGVQEDVARSIADALQLRLSAEEKQRLVERPIRNLQAYECFLRAKYELSRFGEEGIDRALRLLEQALKLEGPNEVLFGALGLANLYYLILGVRPDDRFLEQAEGWAAKAFELNPDSAEGNSVLGFVLKIRGETQDAVRRVKMALRVDPENERALFLLTYVCGISGQMSAARTYYQRLSIIDPLTGGMNPGWVDTFSRNWDKAVEGYRTEYEMDPESPYGRWAWGNTLALAGRPDEAAEVLEELVRDTPETVFGQLGSFQLHTLRGNTEEALQAVTPELVASARIDPILAFVIAWHYATIRRVEEAVEWLKHAIRYGFINYPFISQTEPFLANLSGDPRYEALLAEAKYRWENFEV